LEGYCEAIMVISHTSSLSVCTPKEVSNTLRTKEKADYRPETQRVALMKALENEYVQEGKEEIDI